MSESSSQTKGNVVSASFLVAGTCIGGGMLALPVATGLSGFFPSLVIMFLCWLSMTATAMLLLEVSLWMEEGAHIITMTSRLLGWPGRWLSWVLYLFICYASIIAYTAGGGMQVSSAFNQFFEISLSKEMGCFLFIILFGGMIYFGNIFVGKVNSILFISMIIAYFCLVGMGLDEVKPNLLFHRQWSGAIMAIPLLLTAFSFQTMVPSLTPYLKRNAKHLRIAIVSGTLIAFGLYAIWQWLILGIVPVGGEYGLAAALERGEPATQFLHEHVEGKWISSVAQYFAFFAIVTSFLGMTLGLFDFLSDGLKIQKEKWGGIFLSLLIMIPTFFFASYFERVFLLALDASGGYGDTILNGILPVAMVWIGRYRMGYTQTLCLPGGKTFLIIILCFFVFSLGLEILAHTGQINSFYQAYDLFEKKLPQES